MIVNDVIANCVKTNSFILNESSGKEKELVEKTKNGMGWKCTDFLLCETKSTKNAKIKNRDHVFFETVIHQQGNSISLLEDGRFLLKKGNTYLLEVMLNNFKLNITNRFKICWFDVNENKKIGLGSEFDCDMELDGPLVVYGFPICKAVFHAGKNTLIELRVFIHLYGSGYVEEGEGYMTGGSRDEDGKPYFTKEQTQIHRINQANVIIKVV